jgi:hypothetical protein
VRLLELRDLEGRALPVFAPGAHVDLKLNGGLTPEERAASRTMMICVSGAKTGRLVLDL